MNLNDFKIKMSEFFEAFSIFLMTYVNSDKQTLMVAESFGH